MSQAIISPVAVLARGSLPAVCRHVNELEIAVGKVVPEIVCFHCNSESETKFDITLLICSSISAYSGYTWIIRIPSLQ